jgi:hypothetical protein
METRIGLSGDALKIGVHPNEGSCVDATPYRVLT